MYAVHATLQAVHSILAYVHFPTSCCRPSPPPSRSGVEAVYRVWVRGEELARLVSSLGSTPPSTFSVVVGVRSLEARDHLLEED